MIKIDYVVTSGWETAIRGMRNPMNSWDKSDSECATIIRVEDKYIEDFIGPSDLKLMESLVKAGSDHRKFMRMIMVSMDITAPLYWWKEFDTYKVGTVANSCSTMHKIHAKEFTLDDFSHEQLMTGIDSASELTDVNGDETDILVTPASWLNITIALLNNYRLRYLQTKDKKWWWQMIQLLPSSYNQKRTVLLNYEVLRNMYHARKDHKLDEWHTFCEHIETLPYSHLITQ